jgi:DNA (cytosine-5)-methyltransferase 1
MTINKSGAKTFIDLFAGAGGLSEGFIRAGFEPVAHVEMDLAACNTLKTRVAFHYLKQNNQLDTYKAYLKKEINRDELYNKLPKDLFESVINLPISAQNNPRIHKKIGQLLNRRNVDLIIGGPPCQAYSLVGRARSSTSMQDDHRNYLYVHYAKYLEKYKPKMFVFENVMGLVSAGNGNYLNNMLNLFDKKDYKAKLFIVQAKRFGVLQNRKRVIIVGKQKSETFDLPDLENIDFSIQGIVNDVLKDLPNIEAGGGLDKYQIYEDNSSEYLRISGIRNGLSVLTQHIARPHTLQDKEIYKIAVGLLKDGKRLNYNDLPNKLKTHANRDSFFDRFKVVDGMAASSHTIVAHISRDGHYYIHPDINQNRSLTVREAARLQSFSDDYYFEGVKEGKNRTAAFKQIGNAVPPLLAYHVALEILPLL